MNKMYKQSQYILISFLLLIASKGFSQEVDFPERPQPPQIVNDFAEVLSPQEQQQLERKLVQFNRQTSTQIAIVTLNDLRGFEASDYAVRLAHEWGIGQGDKDNGILILVSPAQRETFIATGYGLEGAVPDATASRIVDNELLPNFRNNNYYKGLDEATTVLFNLTRGEYTAENYMERTGGSGKKGSKAPYPIGIVFLLVIIFSIIGRVKRARHYSMGHNVPFWVALTMLSSTSHRQHGSFNNFSSGSGNFGGMGGGGGGFGGFGGGGFGGGGAGGSW